MKRWFLAGLLPAGVLTAIAWQVISTRSSGKPVSNGITARWIEPAWSEDPQGKSAAQFAGFEYRNVRIRNEGSRERANVCLYPSAYPDAAAVEKAARNVSTSGNLRPGTNIELSYRRGKGERMMLSVITFDFTASELATRIDQRARFPWAKVLLPLRHRIITLPQD